MYEVELRILAVVVIRDVSGQANRDAPLVRWAEAAVRPRVRARGPVYVRREHGTAPRPPLEVEADIGGRRCYLDLDRDPLSLG